MIKIAPRIKIAPNVQKRSKTFKKVQNYSKSSKNARKRPKMFQMFSRSHRAARSLPQPPPQPRWSPLRLLRPRPRRCRAAVAAGAIFFKAPLTQCLKSSRERTRGKIASAKGSCVVLSHLWESRELHNSLHSNEF